MAHANPEYALGLMRPSIGPVSHQLEPSASFGALRRRMYDIEALGDLASPHQRQLLAVWHTTRRQHQHQKRCDARFTPVVDALSEAPGGMHAGGKSGERFIEPKRRLPNDMQAGRTKARRAPVWS